MYFQYWNVAQTVVGILTLWFVTKIAGVDRAKWCIVAMLGISLFVMAVLTPPIVSVGRSLDFVARDAPPPEVVSALRTFGPSSCDLYRVYIHESDSGGSGNPMDPESKRILSESLLLQV